MYFIGKYLKTRNMQTSQVFAQQVTGFNYALLEAKES